MRPQDRIVSQIALASTALLMMAQTGHAIILNDPAAADHGGIENFYDSNNLYSNVVSLYNMNKLQSNCTGTLIDSRTILTAAHCVVNNKDEISDYVATAEIRFAPDAHNHTSSDRQVSGVIILGDYSDSSFALHDMALLSLAQPLADIAPVHLWREGDLVAGFGSLAAIAGYGDLGTGTTGQQNVYDAKRRYGETVIGGYQADGSNPHPVYWAQFRDPDNPEQWDFHGLTKAGVPIPYMQASPGPGDSGGPLFLITPQGLIQIGTVIGIVGVDNLPMNASYGSLDTWMPVPFFRDWIDANSGLRFVSSVGGDHKWSSASGWADAVNGVGALPDNRHGGFDGRGTMGRYYMVDLARSGTVDVDMNPTIDGLSVSHAGAVLHIGSGRELNVLGRMSLTGGRVQLDGRLATVHASLGGGILQGHGVVASVHGVLNNAGIVAPQGLMKVDGDYYQGAKGTLQIGVGTGADRLGVSGAATISGGLKLVQNGTLSVDQAFTVLDASGISGRFDTVGYQFRSAFLEPGVSYGNNKVNIVVSRNGVGFADVAGTANERAVAGVLDDRANPLNSVLLQMSRSEARSAFDVLGGRVFADLRTVSEGAAGRGLSAAMQRLSGMGGSAIRVIEPLGYAALQGDGAAQDTGPYSPHYTMWGSVSAQWSDGGVLKNSGHGINLGFDAQSEGWRVGVLLGRDDVSFSRAADKFNGRSETYMIGGYAGTQWGNVTGRFAAVLGSYDMSTTRSVLVSGLSEILTGNQRGTVAGGSVEVGYRFELGGSGVVEPFVGLEHRHGWGLSFTENGGTSRLHVSTPSSDTTIMSVGLRGEVPFHVSGVDLKAHGGAAWEHDIARSGSRTVNMFSTGGLFTQFGEDAGRDRARVQVGLDAHLSRAVSVGLNYEGAFGAGNQHAMQIKISGKF